MSTQLEELLKMSEQVGVKISDRVLETFTGTDEELCKLLIKIINDKLGGKLDDLPSGDNIASIVNLGKIE